LNSRPVNPVHGAVGPSWHRAVGRQHRRLVRQRAGGERNRAVQDAGDPSSRAVEGDPQRRVRDARVGLVASAAACSNRSATLPRPSSTRPTMTGRPLQSAWRFKRNELSGSPTRFSVRRGRTLWPFIRSPPMSAPWRLAFRLRKVPPRVGATEGAGARKTRRRQRSRCSTDNTARA
jgi:hypothetical protein